MNARRRLTAVFLVLLLSVACAAPVSVPQLRLAPSDVDAIPTHEAGAGTPGVSGIRTTVVAGDPSMPGPYTIRLRVADEAGARAPPPGSFYTEPGGVAHFTETKADPVLLYITGTEPTDTRYVQDAADTPHR